MTSAARTRPVVLPTIQIEPPTIQNENANPKPQIPPEEIKTSSSKLWETLMADEPCDAAFQTYMQGCGFELGNTYAGEIGLIQAVLKSLYSKISDNEFSKRLSLCERAVALLVGADWRASQELLNKKEAQASGSDEKAVSTSIIQTEIFTRLMQGCWDDGNALLALICFLNSHSFMGKELNVVVHLYDRRALRAKDLSFKDGIPHSCKIEWNRHHEGGEERKIYILALETPIARYQVLIPKEIASSSKDKTVTIEKAKSINLEPTQKSVQDENCPPQTNLDEEELPLLESVEDEIDPALESAKGKKSRSREDKSKEEPLAKRTCTVSRNLFPKPEKKVDTVT